MGIKLVQRLHSNWDMTKHDILEAISSTVPGTLEHARILRYAISYGWLSPWCYGYLLALGPEAG